MDRLTAPANLRRATLAAGGTTLAALPELARWTTSPYPLWFSASVAALTSAVMWGFVLAWEGDLLGRRPLAWPRQPQLWLTATIVGLLAAAYRTALVDPRLVADGLAQRPTSLAGWASAGLFQLGFMQLFLVFAPVAVCARLFARREAGPVAVVLLGLYVCSRLLDRAQGAHATSLTALIVLGRAVGDGATAWVYQRGGLWPAWWLALLVHSRHLAYLLGHSPDR